MIAHKVKHVLIQCTFNIGDVLLTLPLAGILKQHFPDIKISFLGMEYTRTIAEFSSHVSQFYSWDALSQMKKADAVAYIKAQAFDVIIHESPNKEIAILMKQAGIPFRIGTSRRLYHWTTCNKRVALSRKKSNLHEAQNNLKLLEPFNIKANNDLNYLRERIGLKNVDPLPPQLQSILNPNKFNLIVHPFTNGHTREWPVSHFIELINQLPREQFNIILTGSKKENEIISEHILPYCPQITNFAGQSTLTEFMQLIAHADGLVANITGPFHLATVLGIRVLGLFPFIRYINVKRWGPIDKKAEVLIADPYCNAPTCADLNDCLCMESITVEQVKKIIINWL